MSSSPFADSTVYSLLRPYKRPLFALADAVLVALSLYGAFLLRFDGSFSVEYHDRFLVYVGLNIFLNLCFFFQQRLYAFSWDFVSLQDLTRLLKAVVFANVLFAFVIFVARENTQLFSGFPRSVVFINFILTLIFVGALRMGKRLWQESFQKNIFSGTQKTLIVGAGVEGDQLLRNLLKHRNTVHLPIGIVDHRSEKQRMSLQGVKVLGRIEDIPEIVKNNEVEHLIIALTSADASLIQQAVAAARETQIKHIKIIPDTYEMLSGRVQMSDLREVRIEDLLGRRPAHIETKRIKKFIEDKVVLVTGAAGSIGSELARQILAFNPQKLLLIDFNESGLFDLAAELEMAIPGAPLRCFIANITDREKIFRIVKDEKPSVVFHAAAYKHVPFMEEFPEEAIAVNVFGTFNVAEAAFQHHAETLVLISTDKAIHPLSVMGKTKRAAELIVQSMNNAHRMRAIAVRFGNVIGSRGSVIPLFQEQIRRRAPVTVTHPEMTRYFMTIREAALLVTEAGAVGKGGEVFMLDMGQPVKIVDMARELIRLSGLQPDVDIPIVFTQPRPGEKIAEEIFSPDERQIGTTQWDKIFVMKDEKTVRYETINRELEYVKKILDESTTDQLKAILDRFLFMSASK